MIGDKAQLPKTELAMSVKCRLYSERDRDALAGLFVELQTFHGLPQQTRESIASDIDRMPASFEVWLAEDAGGAIVGFALASVYPGPGIAAGLYLKELFVTEAARTGGVGRVLMQSLAKAATRRGIQRIDWVTTYENMKARRFYEGLGARADEHKVFYRLGRDELVTLARSG